MPLNNPDAPSAVLRPRLRVIIGNALAPAVAASVTQTGTFHADRFSAAFQLMPSGVGSLAWWEAQKPPVLVDVQIGYLPPGAPEGAVSGWVSLAQGEIDSRGFQLGHAGVHIEGRDLTARLIDNKRQAAFSNQTASEIVTYLAQQHSLTPDVQKTTTPVGRYYQIEHDTISLDQFHRVTTDWDLCVTLARFEGFDVWVTGTTLHFRPPPPQNADPYVVRWLTDQRGVPVSNALDLELERADTIAKGIQVIVKSWNSKQGRGFIRGAPGNIPIKSIGDSTKQQYVFIRPNMTEDQAQQLANRLYSEISQHERRIEVELIPDLILSPRTLVRLEGTGSSFDQVYYPAEVQRSISGNHFSMRLSARNHDVASYAATGI